MNRTRVLRAVPSNEPVRNFEPDAQSETVRRELPTAWGNSDFIMQFAQVNDGIMPWGENVFSRDIQLRSFWPTEPLFAGALFTKLSQYVSLDYYIEGPDSQVELVGDMLESCEDGKGFQYMMMKFLNDLYTQDNGAFLEIVRLEDDALSPVVTMNHLDAGRCIRTGNRMEPVIYMDSFGFQHKMKWYQIMMDVEMPTPIERLRGIQVCVLSRLLTAAQIMKNIETFHREKTAGQFNKEIHFIGGVARKTIDNAVARDQIANDQMGLVRFAPALIVAGIDPTTRVSKETIEFAKLPEGFKLEEWLRYYFTQFALAWGADYQDFAPLMSGSSASSSGGQSNALHTKARGKGIALFMTRLMHNFNFHGIMPRTCEFKYGEQDKLADLELSEVRKSRAQERQIRVLSNEITPNIARMIAHDQGDLTDDQYAALLADPDLQTAAPAEVFPGGPQANKPNPMADGKTSSPAGGSQPSPSRNAQTATGKKEGAGKASLDDLQMMLTEIMDAQQVVPVEAVHAS